jgi:aminoglycoside 6'-N-acetyltransferase
MTVVPLRNGAMTGGSSDPLRSHTFYRTTPRLRLRPATAEDWPVLVRWNQDPRVLLYWNDGDTRPWGLEKVQKVYRSIAERAFLFIVERDGRPIGECWLQEMNLPAILSAYPARPLFRIDLSIGEPEQWGRGLGTETVQALVEFGFRDQRAAAIFASHVRPSNVASRRLFERLKFEDWGEGAGAADWGNGQPPRHMVLTRERWGATRPAPASAEARGPDPG